MKFCEKFEKLVAPLQREERDILDIIFLNGLKNEIQAEMKLYDHKIWQMLWIMHYC